VKVGVPGNHNGAALPRGFKDCGVAASRHAEFADVLNREPCLMQMMRSRPRQPLIEEEPHSAIGLTVL